MLKDFFLPFLKCIPWKIFSKCMLSLKDNFQKQRMGVLLIVRKVKLLAMINK